MIFCAQNGCGGVYVRARLSYANTILFPIALVKRLVEKYFPPSEPQSDLEAEMGFLNRLFQFLLSLEAPFVASMGLPFGLSVIAMGRKQV